MVLKKPKSVGKKLNKKDLLSTNLATNKGYCTQHKCCVQVAFMSVKSKYEHFFI